jgi:hypothetical protein
LLSSFIDIIKDVPREKRIKFIASQMSNGTTLVMHPYAHGKHISTLLGDIQSLAGEGLLSLTYNDKSTYNFDITPTGFKFIEYQQTQLASVSQRIEKQLRNFFSSDDFKELFPLAYNKWSKAESKLWSDDSKEELSIIGHLCRESMQEFVNALVEKYQPPNVDQDKSHDISRLKSVFAQRADTIPKTLLPFLNALLDYWGTLNDLVQRQVHSAQKEGGKITWEDAKRVVFHTAVVFLEVHKVLSATA